MEDFSVNKISEGKIELLLNTFKVDHYGSLHLFIDGKDFFEYGFAYGDIVNVEFLDKCVTMPFVKNYNFIDNGACALAYDDTYLISKDMSILANGGAFAPYYGLADYIDGKIVGRSDIQLPLKLTISIKEKEGYLEIFKLYKRLVDERTNNREDYASYSDEQFVNFRTVSSSNIKAGRVYRCSTPIANVFNRNEISNEVIKKNNIHRIINLSDNEDYVKSGRNPHYFLANTYYSEQEILWLGLPADYYSSAFSEGLVKAIRFMISDSSPVLIHCMEGKDRTGFVIGVFQALMGDKNVEIMREYLISYQNFFKMPVDSEDAPFVGLKIIDNLTSAFKERIKNENSSILATKYLLNIGLDMSEINKLKNYLRGE